MRKGKLRKFNIGKKITPVHTDIDSPIITTIGHTISWRVWIEVDIFVTGIKTLLEDQTEREINRRWNKDSGRKRTKK